MKKYVLMEGDVAVIGTYDGYTVLRVHPGRDSERLTFFNLYQENELRDWIDDQGLVRVKAQKGLSLGGWYRKGETGEKKAE